MLVVEPGENICKLPLPGILMTCIVITWNIVWIMAHFDRIIRARAYNKVLWRRGGGENICVAKLFVTWLPTLLPLDSCLACHSDPTILSRLLFVSPPTTELRTPWKLNKNIMFVMMLLEMRTFLLDWQLTFVARTWDINYHQTSTAQTKNILSIRRENKSLI